MKTTNLKITAGGKRLISWSFIIIMAAHLAVFTALGLFTESGWRLLIIFLAGLFVMAAVKIIRKAVSKTFPP